MRLLIEPLDASIGSASTLVESDGEYVNRAQAVSTASGLLLSGEAFATVRVLPDPTFACTDVIGKVFDDQNHKPAFDEIQERFFESYGYRF